MNTEMMRALRMMLFGNSTGSINCLQFGDTGKGKFVDFVTKYWPADIVVRPRGGANAGHTVYPGDGGDPIVFHLLPSGMHHDGAGVINIMGNGMAIDPFTVVDEIKALWATGSTTNHLMISNMAQLALPLHIARDCIREMTAGEVKIGTTKRGIGPTYGDHVTRDGLKINDLLNPDFLAERLRVNITLSRRFLHGLDPEVIKKVLKGIRGGIFYHPTEIFDFDAMMSALAEATLVLEPFIYDTDSFVRANWKMKNILLEGAQGDLLDIDYGTYPYVTSSRCGFLGMAEGAGLRDASQIGYPLAVMKGFYMTRVGEGPFPTKLLPDNPLAKIIQDTGKEFGATTGRPRDIGWFDLPLLRYSLGLAGRRMHLVMTKLDVLTGVSEIPVCVAYTFKGSYRWGNKTFKDGDILETAIPSAEILSRCQPIYKYFPGWDEPLGEIRAYKDLPQNLRNLVEEFRLDPAIISVGPRPEETIIV